MQSAALLSSSGNFVPIGYAIETARNRNSTRCSSFFIRQPPHPVIMSDVKNIERNSTLCFSPLCRQQSCRTVLQRRSNIKRNSTLCLCVLCFSLQTRTASSCQSCTTLINREKQQYSSSGNRLVIRSCNCLIQREKPTLFLVSPHQATASESLCDPATMLMQR
jgi:hypothetical protein